MMYPFCKYPDETEVVFSNIRKKDKNQNSGITLISLIITIIVLLILAGVALNFVVGENGILKHAEFAREKYENKAQIEQNELAQLDDYISNGRDTITISKEEYDMLKNANTYSEDETVVGTWMNKPLYRKVIFNNSLKSIQAGTWTNYYLATELHIENLTKGSFGRKNTNGLICDFMNDINVFYDSSTGYLKIHRDISALNFANYSLIIIEYTKTTDTATNN